LYNSRAILLLSVLLLAYQVEQAELDTPIPLSRCQLRSGWLHCNHNARRQTWTSQSRRGRIEKEERRAHQQVSINSLRLLLNLVAQFDRLNLEWSASKWLPMEQNGQPG